MYELECIIGASIIRYARQRDSPKRAKQPRFFSRRRAALAFPESGKETHNDLWSALGNGERWNCGRPSQGWTVNRRKTGTRVTEESREERERTSRGENWKREWKRVSHTRGVPFETSHYSLQKKVNFKWNLSLVCFLWIDHQSCSTWTTAFWFFSLTLWVGTASVNVAWYRGCTRGKKRRLEKEMKWLSMGNEIDESRRPGVLKNTSEIVFAAVTEAFSFETVVEKKLRHCPSWFPRRRLLCSPFLTAPRIDGTSRLIAYRRSSRVIAWKLNDIIRRRFTRELESVKNPARLFKRTSLIILP